MSDESPAYQRLKQAAAQASAGAALLALHTLKDVHWECVALEAEWHGRDGESAAEVRAALARIRAKLAPATTVPWGDRKPPKQKPYACRCQGSGLGPRRNGEFACPDCNGGPAEGRPESEEPDAAPEPTPWVGATELAPNRSITELAATGLVGYRQNSGRLLHCLAHKPAPTSRYADFHEVTAGDLEDGGICVHPRCGRDLLAPWNSTGDDSA